MKRGHMNHEGCRSDGCSRGFVAVVGSDGERAWDVCEECNRLRAKDGGCSHLKAAPAVRPGVSNGAGVRSELKRLRAENARLRDLLVCVQAGIPAAYESDDWYAAMELVNCIDSEVKP